MSMGVSWDIETPCTDWDDLLNKSWCIMTAHEKPKEKKRAPMPTNTYVEVEEGEVFHITLTRSAAETLSVLLGATGTKEGCDSLFDQLITELSGDIHTWTEQVKANHRITPASPQLLCLHKR